MTYAEIPLNKEQMQTISAELKRYGLQDYSKHLELIVLGYASGEDILRLVRVFCQTSYLKGRMDEVLSHNQTLKEYVREGDDSEYRTQDNKT